MGLSQALLALHLALKSLIELGVLGFERLHKVEGLVTPGGGDVEKPGYDQRGDEPDEERDPGEGVGKEPAQARAKADGHHEDRIAMRLHVDLNGGGGLTTAGTSTSLTVRSLRALQRNPTATQLSGSGGPGVGSDQQLHERRSKTRSTR
jgi:hypothetical protein